MGDPEPGILGLIDDILAADGPYEAAAKAFVEEVCDEPPDWTLAQSIVSFQSGMTQALERLGVVMTECAKAMVRLTEAYSRKLPYQAAPASGEKPWRSEKRWRSQGE